MTWNPPDQDPAFRRVAAEQGFGVPFGGVFQGDSPDGPVFAFRVSETHLNGIGVCHGGATATFADIAQGRALHGHLGPNGEVAVTVNLSIDYIAAARLGEWLTCTPQILRFSRRLIFTTAIILAGERIVARSGAIFSRLAGRQDS